MLSIKNSNCAFYVGEKSGLNNKKQMIVPTKDFDYSFPIIDGHVYKQNFNLLVKKNEYLFEISFGFGTINFILDSKIIKTIEYDHKDAGKIRSAREYIENMTISEFFKFIECAK